MNMNHMIAFNLLNLVFLNKYFTFNLNILTTTGYSSFDFIKAPGYKINDVMNKLNKQIIEATDRETKPKSKTTSNLNNQAKFIVFGDLFFNSNLSKEKNIFHI